MSYNIIYTGEFEKEIKRLSKKHLSLKKDFRLLLKTLSANPKTGSLLGNDCFKIRLSVTSKGKGKSGGARVITHVAVKGNNNFNQHLRQIRTIDHYQC